MGFAGRGVLSSLPLLSFLCEVSGFNCEAKMKMESVSSTWATAQFVNTVAAELALSVDTAVESWMAQIERASTDPALTTLGRMAAVKEIVSRYKHFSGKAQLQCRRACATPIQGDLRP